jgi:hypothetical protein
MALAEYTDSASYAYGTEIFFAAVNPQAAGGECFYEAHK